MQVQNKQSITVDLRRSMTMPVPRYRQYDTNILEIVVLDNKEAADLTNIEISTANYKRPDNEVISRTVQKNGNVITYKIGNEESAVPGNGELSLHFYSGTDRLSTMRVQLRIDQSLEPSIQGTEDLTLLQELFFEVSENLRAINQTNEAINANEADRQNAESNRVLAENSRVEAETARGVAESERTTAEEGRKTAETNRATTEGNRTTAEEARNTAEGVRNTAETARQEAEGNRTLAETARENAEEARETAEAKRQTDTQTAIQNAEIATGNAQAVADNTVHKGEFDLGVSYKKNNVVTLNGSSYMAIQSSKGIVPPNTTYWQLVAQKGVDGTGSVSTVNGVGPDENGNVTVEIPDPDLSGLATKQEVQDVGTALVSHQADYKTHTGYAVAAGTANAYTATLTPALSAYAEGVSLRLKINVDNTGASTVNVNSLGAKAIKKANGADVNAGQLKAGSIYTLAYNGTNFILQGEGSDLSDTDKTNLINSINNILAM
ncbi:hypothetical protein [Pseudobacillus badius]|uniref:hypothetical protein n=1 Tax=Bacillus badius TaxID=1455 RepID=UPI0007B37460|nr:hypothetical protein [Bacillus badius]KZR60383.1 hypothetical protein A3781_09430 [Bacillus badius]